LGILTRIEKELGVDFSKIELSDLCEVLPRFLTQNLNLAKSVEFDILKNEVNLKILGSVYNGLYQTENGLKSVSLLGCPIASAVACVLAKTSGKLVTIPSLLLSPDRSTIIVQYGFV
jgi:hypothetical protein